MFCLALGHAFDLWSVGEGFVDLDEIHLGDLELCSFFRATLYF